MSNIKMNYVKNKSLELFHINDAEDGLAVDLHIYDTLQELLEYSKEVGPLLNSVNFLNSKYEITKEQEILIKEILKSKRLEIS